MQGQVTNTPFYKDLYDAYKLLHATGITTLIISRLRTIILITFCQFIM